MTGVFAAVTQHHHLVGDDFDGRVFHAFAVFPTAGLQAAFDVDLLAFGQVLLADFGQVAPGDDVEPLGFCVAFAVASNSRCGWWLR